MHALQNCILFSNKIDIHYKRKKFLPRQIIETNRRIIYLNGNIIVLDFITKNVHVILVAK